MRTRIGGTVTNIVVGASILFLVVSTIFYYWRNQVAPIAGPTSSVISSSSTSSTSWSFLTSTTTATSSSHLENITLGDLRNLSFANASKCDALHDRAFWDTAMITSGNVTNGLLKNTVYGFANEASGWAALFRNNSAPAWMSFGLRNYTDTFVAAIAAKVMGTDNVTQAAGVVKGLTSYAGGLSATALNWVFLGALSGEKVQLTTHNSSLAWSATFPGQLYRTYQLSFDCSYSEQQRAQFFGTALSMTALLVATSGRDGFGPKFEGLLDELGLRDAWMGIKWDVKAIADTSPGAAYQTVMVLSALAKKFPSDKFPDLASFTSSRIANMVKVLNDKGLTPDEIQQKVADLSKVVDESDNEGHVADVADATSYQAEGFVMVWITSDRTAVLYYPRGGQPLTASFLALILPDFKVGEVTALKVTVHKSWYTLDTQLTSYEEYQAGTYVSFSLPDKEVKPGDKVGLSFEILPVEDFASSIGTFTLTSPPGVRWVADAVTLKNFKVIDSVLQFDVFQTNRWTGITEFTMSGEIVKYPGLSRSGGVGIYAEFAIKDYAGRTRDLLLRYDGFSFQGASLQLVQSDTTLPISLISYDGFRLKIVYESDNNVGTIYLNPPSDALYIESTMHPYSGPYLKLVEGKYTNAWQIDSVAMPRDLEKQMLSDGGTYDLGRLGSEISYVVADKQLGLKNLVIEEPSVGGRDLYTQDNTVAIQARFLKNFKTVDREAKIQGALFDLAQKLQQDYRNQPQMQDGYAILSYVDTDGTVKTIILEVPRW